MQTVCTEHLYPPYFLPSLLDSDISLIDGHTHRPLPRVHLLDSKSRLTNNSQHIIKLLNSSDDHTTTIK